MSSLLAPSSLPYKTYRGFAVAASFLQAPLLLAMRIAWGYQFFIAGKGKLGNLDNVADFFEKLGIVAPKANAIVASCTECFGGLLLLIGLGGRLVSLPLAFTMLVAYWTADREALYSLDKFVAATPFPFLVTALVVLVFGPGLFSVDGLLAKTVFKKYRTPHGFDGV